MSLNTVGVITISEDILLDRKIDSCSKFLIKELNSLQFHVWKVTVITEKENVIVSELDSMIKNCDIVLVVCERDSSLYQALAKMTSQKQVPNETLARILNDIKEPHDSQHVLLPCQAKILSCNNHYPIVHFQRIFMLKERYLKQSFSKILRGHLLQYRKERCFRKFMTITQNGNVANDLNEINKLLLQKNVNIKSKKEGQHFTIEVSSAILGNMVEFENIIKDKFEPYRIQFSEGSEVWNDVYSSTDEHVKNSVEIIEKCIEQYGMKNIFVCFNGGKDCTVLLHLVLTVLKKKYPHYKKPLFCLYVQSDRPFPEQEEFINQVQSYYDLEIQIIQSGIKDALQQTLLRFPNYKACFMGTRRTDPYSGDLNAFQLTDVNWPQIMRVSPLLDWHYSDIWDYLLFFKVPYCVLYDKGFTSLGNTTNTTKNPSLLYYDKYEDEEVCLPAYKLLKEEKERNGRNLS